MARIPYFILFLTGLAASEAWSQSDRSESVSLNGIKTLLNDHDGLADGGSRNCGIACLYLFLKLHGVQNAGYAEIERQVSIGKNGASLHSLADASKKFGLEATPLRCAPDKLSVLRLPVIAHIEQFGKHGQNLHYVVISRVTESEVTLFDPFGNEVRKVDRHALGALLTGHFLAPTPSPSSARLGTSLTILGTLLAAIGIFQVSRARRNNRRRQDTLLSNPILACIIAACSCCMHGCDGRGSERQPKLEVQRPAENSIEARVRSLELGEIRMGDEAEAKFEFRNKSSNSVKLRMGPASCSCATAKLLESEELRPGETGHLVLRINTARQPKAGKIEACASLFAGESEAPLRFCATGFMDGIVFPREKYVIRPAHLQAGKIPPLRFHVITHTEAPFKITRITCASFADLAEMISEDRSRIHTELCEAKPTFPVVAETENLSMPPPRFRASESVYIRAVEIPMRLGEAPRAFSGAIIVDYVIGDEAMQVHTDLLVLGATDK